MQIWTNQYPVVLSSRGISKVVDIFATESSWLGRLGGYNDDRRANLSSQQDHLAWDRTQPIESVANNLIDKYLLQFDHQMQLSKDAGDQFYGQASARLASYRIDLGDPGANLLTPEPHTEWARDQSAEELRDTLRTKVRFLMAGAVIDTSE